MTETYLVPTRLDDPELIGLWTIDEFAAIIIPFAWGILSGHMFVGMGAALGCCYGLRKAKAGRSLSWLLALAYWHLPHSASGLRATPPSALRTLVG
jgi:conjugal transfer pilus assembly protein TraL